MAAFNNYCSNCDKLIPSDNPNSEDLYCSEDCKVHDQHIIESNTVENQMLNDAILKSPLLLPMQDEFNTFDNDRYSNNSDLPIYRNINIPFSYNKDSIALSILNDNMAENYYKLWLHNNI